MMAVLTKALHNITNNTTSSIETRYALSLITVFTGCLYKPRSATNRIIIALLALYLAYGINQLVFIALTILLNLSLIKLSCLPINEYFFVVMNIIILYLFKIFGYRIEPQIQTTYDISGFLMVLVIKTSYLVRDYKEIRKNEQPTISAADIIEYLVFLPGLLSGPTMTFKEYLSTNKTERTELPAKQCLKTLCFLLIYTKLGKYPFKTYILSEQTPVLLRFLLLYLYNVVLRSKFHFIWNFAHCCYLLHGRDEFLNIDFYKVELTESVREISSNWNKFVSRWLKEMFFIRLKNSSMSPATAAIITHLISASLHGLNCCYLIFFLSLGLFSKLITRINTLLPFKFIRQFQMSCFITFFSMPFYILSLKETYLVWKAVYFYGLVYCISMTFFFLIYDYITKKKLTVVSKVPEMDVYIKNK